MPEHEDFLESAGEACDHRVEDARVPGLANGLRCCAGVGRGPPRLTAARAEKHEGLAAGEARHPRADVPDHVDSERGDLEDSEHGLLHGVFGECLFLEDAPGVRDHNRVHQRVEAACRRLIAAPARPEQGTLFGCGWHGPSG